jgi:molybdopterin converting factor small subunit
MSAEIIASLKREMAAKEESFRLQLAAKDEIIARTDQQLADKDRIIDQSEQTIKALQDQIFDLRHLLAQKMTKEELADYPFVVGVADNHKKSRKRI